MTNTKSLSLAVAAAAMAFTHVSVFAQQEEQYEQQPKQLFQLPQQQAYPQQQYQQQSNQEQRKKVSNLIRRGIKRSNKEEIHKEASYLSEADRTALYYKYQKEAAAGWAALDFFPGFGVGSFYQRDYLFGFAQFGIDVLGYILLINAVEEGKDDDIYTALFIVCSSRILSWIFPFIHQSKYNMHLRDVLKPDIFAYSIDPLLVPRDGIPAIGLAFNFRY